MKNHTMCKQMFQSWHKRKIGGSQENPHLYKLNNKKKRISNILSFYYKREVHNSINPNRKARKSDDKETVVRVNGSKIKM